MTDLSHTHVIEYQCDNGTEHHHKSTHTHDGGEVLHMHDVPGVETVESGVKELETPPTPVKTGSKLWDGE